MTEEEKMKEGLYYDPGDEVLVAKRMRAHVLSRQYNETDEYMVPERKRILKMLLPHAHESAVLLGPIQFDYGENTTIGKNFFANFNFTVLDCAPVVIGDDVFVGPNVSLMTPLHPLRFEDRNAYPKADGTWTDQERARPIVIERNCWLAANVVVLPGVTIHEGSVIGAGSVVTKDIPPHSLAFGSPCRVHRTIGEGDEVDFEKEALRGQDL